MENTNIHHCEHHGGRRTRRLVGVAAVLVAASWLVAPKAAVASLATSTTTMAESSIALAESSVATTFLSLPSPVPRIVELQLTLRLLVASLLGAAVGQERSMTHKHSAGVRTMALVALGACAFTVCSQFGFNAVGRCDPSRMASNVASGVGFVGAGVITTSTGTNPSDSRQSIVHGLTTATAIWISAAIGVACGVGMFYIATAATLSTITILKFGGFKKKFKKLTEHGQQSKSTSNSVTTKTEKPQSIRVVSTTPEELPLVKSTTASLEAMDDEDDDDDDWDYHVESADEQDDDEEDDATTEEEEEIDRKRPVLPMKEDLPELDELIEAYHRSGQSEILEKALAASTARNLTGLVTSSSSKGSKRHDEDNYKGSTKDNLHRLEPRQPLYVSKRGNETFRP
eukprot:Sro341_g121470.1 Protein MgtC (400) ;mRNA; r:42395-43594